MTISERWAQIWSSIRGSPAEVIRSVAIPPERVTLSGSAYPRLEAGKHYFSVLMNELFLAESRQWFNLYDPMAFVVSEFTYNGKPTTVPFVVGPSLLEGKIQHVPNGIAITDTEVAGIHPYVGGKFALTVILAQVKRDSYAKRLLQVVENVATAFPLGAALEPHLKVAGAVMDGVESLLGMTETKALAGHRWEYNDGISPWLEPGFFVLMNMDEGKAEAALPSVVKGRLRSGVGEHAPTYRGGDYLLYSLCCFGSRTDVHELPFYQKFENALRVAGSLEAGSWERAKAALVMVYQEMVTSPDLTWEQVQQLTDSFRQRLLQVHEQTKSFSVLSSGAAGASTVSASLKTDAGELFAGPNTEARLRGLREVHKLLDL